MGDDGNKGNGSGFSAWDPHGPIERYRSKLPPPKPAPTKRKRKPRRPPIPVPYGSIPYAYTDKLQDAGVSGTTWALLFHLDRLIYGPARKEPLTISTEFYQSSRLTRWQVACGLRQLERAGLVTLRRHGGRSFDVFPLWRSVPS
jgi:hypothetical protein